VWSIYQALCSQAPILVNRRKRESLSIKDAFIWQIHEQFIQMRPDGVSYYLSDKIGVMQPIGGA
jgi:hypothetical protein